MLMVVAKYSPLWYRTVDVASPQRARGARPALAFVEVNSQTKVE